MLKKIIFVLLVGLLLILPLAGVIGNQWWRGGYGLAVDAGDGLDFIWTDAAGQTHRFNDEKRGPTVLFLGYLECTDFCPLRIRQLLELAQIESEEAWQILFVTLDPTRDTPAVRQALELLAPRIQTAALAAPALAVLQGQLQERVTVKQEAIHHAGNLYLFDDQHQLQRVYSQRDLSTNLLLQDIQQLSKKRILVER